MSESKKTIKRQVLPLLALRGLTVFPYMTLHFDVGREKSVKALEEAMSNNQLIFLVTQKDASDDSPGEADIYKVGAISRVKQLLKLPGDTIRVLVEGVNRAEIVEYTQTEPFFMAEVVEKIYAVDTNSNTEIEALKRRILSTFEDYARLSGKITPETVQSFVSIDDCPMTGLFSFVSRVKNDRSILSTEYPKLMGKKGTKRGEIITIITGISKIGVKIASRSFLTF
jgi:ATP-dependent Lon protease